MSRLPVVFAALVGALAIAASVFAVLAWTGLQSQRRRNTITACLRDEREHEGLRVILLSFRVDPAKLPIDPATKRPVLAPLSGHGTVEQRCEAYAKSRT